MLQAADGASGGCWTDLGGGVCGRRTRGETAAAEWRALYEYGVGFSIEGRFGKQDRRITRVS